MVSRLTWYEIHQKEEFTGKLKSFLSPVGPLWKCQSLTYGKYSYAKGGKVHEAPENYAFQHTPGKDYISGSIGFYFATCGLYENIRAAETPWKLQL